ncbi:MAG TPA: NHL repeat-containing protein [bacterium]|jgi:hypothetical protein|nr:NHL repeat-containing protein [bacterium]
MARLKLIALLLLLGLPLSFDWSCSSSNTLTPAPVTVIYQPATNTSTPMPGSPSPTGTNSPTSTSTFTHTATPSPTKGHPLPTDTVTSTPTGSPTPTVTPTPLPSSAWSLSSTLGQNGTDGVNGDFEFPYRVAVGAGFLAVADYNYGNVQVFNNSGQYLYSIPATQPKGLAIDSSGELYIVDTGNSGGEVDGYDLTSGGFTYDYTWDGQGQVAFPTDVKIDAGGNLVVTDPYLGVFNLLWNDDSILHQATGGPSVCPSDVALDAAGNIYTLDSCYGHGVVEYGGGYGYSNSFNGSGWTVPVSGFQGVAVDSTGNLYLSDPGNHRVVYATAGGSYLGEIDSLGNPLGLALDSADDLFVADTTNYTVDEYAK